jgi:hypothetical protein
MNPEIYKQLNCNRTGKICEHIYCQCFTCIDGLEQPEKCGKDCDYRFLCSKDFNEKK